MRIVAFDDERFFGYAHALLAAGLEVAVVLARESFAEADFARLGKLLRAADHPDRVDRWQ